MRDLGWWLPSSLWIFTFYYYRSAFFSMYLCVLFIYIYIYVDAGFELA